MTSPGGLRQSLVLLAGMAAVVLGGWANPAFAGDPFRSASPKAIDNGTEAAFEALFEEGDYDAAEKALQAASENEPLAHTLAAILAYWEDDAVTFEQSGQKTLETAEALMATDPLRGNLYTAVGHILDGAYQFNQAGNIKGTPIALQTLQLVFAHLDAAEKIDPNDPELNLVNGYLDLLLAVNLPFASPNEAIRKLEEEAAPAYVSHRGVALGYRDLKRFDKASLAVDKALALAPDNPELLYLKAQILDKQKNYSESLAFFQKALAKKDQLPDKLIQEITSWQAQVIRKAG